MAGGLLLAFVLSAACSGNDSTSGTVEAFCALARDPGALDGQSFFLELEAVAPSEISGPVGRRANMRHTADDLTEMQDYVERRCGPDVELPFSGL